MNNWSRRSALDRLADTRAPEQLEELWRGAAVLEVDAEGRFAGRGGVPLALPDQQVPHDGDVLLGRHADRIWFARPVERLSAGEPTPWRETDPAHWDLTAAAVALLRWHRGRPLCEACGAPTTPDSAGARRRCTRCGTLAFARQDPAVIVAIQDPDERLLLGRQSVWPAGRFSVIAGFVEPGESLEQAVWREVAEEVGVQVTALAYVSSQPWPAPRSLMLGFVAAAPDDRIEVDGAEIVEAAYWERRALEAALDLGTVTLPGGASIARHLIESWRAGDLPRPRE